MPESLSYTKAGAKVTVLTIHIPGFPLKERVNKNLKIIRVPYFLPLHFQRIRIPNYPLYTKQSLIARFLQLPFFVLSYCLFLFHYVPKHDIIHANWTPTALFGLPVCRIFKRPIFLTFRGSDITKLPIFFNRFIISKMDAVFKWHLGDVCKYIERFKGNYVNLPLITRLSPDRDDKQLVRSDKQKFVFSFVGRLVDDPIQNLKGFDILLSAASKLITKYEKFGRFQIDYLGDGPEKKDLIQKAKKLKIEDHVVFHGHQNDIFPYLKESHAVLGGLGLNAVAQEASFLKKILIMIRGEEWNGKIWIDKTNVLLYEQGNENSLARAMNYAIEHPEKCHHIAERGYVTIRKYACDINEGGKKYVALFNDLISKKG